jgi:hypothetical protein
MEHALRRYAIQDWSLWMFTVEECGSGRKRVLRFKVDHNGEPRRATQRVSLCEPRKQSKGFIVHAASLPSLEA